MLAYVWFYLRSPSSLGSYLPVLSRVVYYRCLELVKCICSTEDKNSELKPALKLSFSLHSWIPDVKEESIIDKLLKEAKLCKGEGF